MEIYQEFTFDAAHRFPGVPEGHPYHGLHGHSFVARVVLLGKVDPRTGFIADLGEIEKSCERLRERLDHKYLNEIDGLEVPSLENIAVRSEEHTSELQSLTNLVCRLLLEKK